MIPLCEPLLGERELEYVTECIRTNWVSSAGRFVDLFEENFAQYCGTKYAVATVNGTAALHIALLVAGVKPDDEVLVSTLTFIAPANAIRYVDAWPVFMDADALYWQMDPEKVIDFLEKECQWRNGALYNKTTGRRVRAILPVHILGHPCDIDPILKIARKYNLVVIEDATESLGAKYKGRMVGHIGDIACFSFNGNKIITTGGGGMIVTDNEEWARRAKYLTTQAKDDPVEYIHHEIGYNYRLTNIQAAMGCAQLERIEDYIITKRRIAAMYVESFKDVPGVVTMQEAEWAYSIFWLFTVLVDEKEYKINSRMLMRKLSDQRVQTRPLWRPIHDLRPYRSCQAYRIEVASRLYKDALSLPSSVGLKKCDQAMVIQKLKEIPLSSESET